MIAVEISHPFADRQAVDLRHRHIGTLFDGEQMLLKLLEVARVIPQRMRAQITLVFEVLEELIYRFV